MAAFSGTGARNVGIYNGMIAENGIKGGREILDGALGSALTSISQGRDLSLGALGRNYGQARSDLTTAFDGAIGRLDPFVNDGRRAGALYQDSLGLNGAEGNGRAVGAFQASPGYQYQVDQATDAVARKASAMGALGSGNTAAAIADRARNLANTEYGGWQDRLAGLDQRAFQAAGAQAGLQGQYGTTLANLGQSQGRDEAGIYTGAATGESNAFQNIAGLGLDNLWNGIGSITNSLANAQKQATDNVNSGYSFGANVIGSLANLATMGMGGGNTLGGNFIKSLGFGGGK